MILDRVCDFFSPLTTMVPATPATLRGEWSTLIRKRYAVASQLGSGEGPFVDVVDHRWRGQVECALPLAGIMIRCTSDSGRWSKSQPAASNAAVSVNIDHWYPPCALVKASLAVGFHGTGLPTVPVAAGADLPSTCELGSGSAICGQPYVVARMGETAFVLVLLQGSLLRTGRNHLWRLRDELAWGLPMELRALLARGRAGDLYSSRLQPT